MSIQSQQPVTTTNKYEIQVNKISDEVKAKLNIQNLFVKPLSSTVPRRPKPPQAEKRKSFHEIETEQKELSFKIGQEIKSRQVQQPRVLDSSDQTDQDFLLVLTSPTTNDEVRATVDSMTMETVPTSKAESETGKPQSHQGSKAPSEKANSVIGSNKGSKAPSVQANSERGSNIGSKAASEEPEERPEETTERPKSVNEMAKEFEDAADLSVKPTVSPTPVIETGLSVKGLKSSFDTVPNGAAETPKLPVRTSSFYRAIEEGQKCPSLGKLSKSTSSLENILDDETSNVVGLSSNHFNDMSMSNPDISDSEIAVVKNLRDAFKKIPMSNSNPYLDPNSPLMNHYGTYGHKMDPNASNPTTKYSRAYLTLVKTGSVNNKLSKFEDPNTIPRGYSQRTLNTTYKKAEKAKDYIAKHATDTTKNVIKTKEVGNVNDKKLKFEMKGKTPIIQNVEPEVQQTQPQQPKGTWTDQKAKLKHFCKKMSHSKILNKMIALQCASQNETLDKGTEKLLIRSNQEEKLKNVYQSGKVESKVDMFEKPAQRPQSPAPAWANKTDKTAFSWSKRLNPEHNSATYAQKHNQFRKYYGYHPSDQQQPKSLTNPADTEALDNEIEPASLPVYLENLPPPPPIRGHLKIKPLKKQLFNLDK